MVCYTRSSKRKVQCLVDNSGDIAIGGQVLRPSALIAKPSAQRNKRRQRDTTVQPLQIPHTQPARLVIIYTKVDACQMDV